MRKLRHRKGVMEFGFEIAVALVLGIVAIMVIYFFVFKDPFGLIKGSMNMIASLKDSFTSFMR